MTTIDYKEKYEQALERARQFSEKPYLEDSAGIVEYIFPELRESEDERIRKAMIDFFKHEREEGITVLHYGVNIECMIDWLEKQVEQKPAWSEEDDDNMIMIEDRLSDYLDYIREDSTLTKHQKNSLKEEVVGYVNWLHSLKDRVQPQSRWKPTDEQILVLEFVMKDIEKDSLRYAVLNSVLEQLKKLKE